MKFHFKTVDVVIPLRFLSIISFLVACLLTTYHTDQIITATYHYEDAIDENYNWSMASIYMNIMLIIFGLVIQLIGMMGGCSMFSIITSITGIDLFDLCV